ncbi:PAS domain-containing protein [Piscinibacter sakaiensis]|uniref:PAS domain-containing protein n=1 Tax=Piscinibacter sakaiensis TaxID=1547922 RepID=UPI003AAF017B
MAPPTQFDPTPRQRWWWRNMAWIGAALVAALTAFAAVDLVKTHRAAVSDTERRIETQARVVAEQTTRSVQAIDLVLRHLAQHTRAGNAAGLHDYLKDQTVGLIQVEALAVFDADGRLLANSRRADPPPLDISSDPLFARLRTERGSRPLIGDARAAWFSDGALVFPIMRRVESTGGRFAGVVYAGARVDYFQQFYNDMQLDSGASIALLKPDGSLLARHPPQPAAVGQRVAHFDELLAAQRAAPTHSLRGKSPVDGIDRFGVARAVPDYPLIVAVSRDASLALLPWREQAAATLVHTLLLGVMSLLLLWLVRRQFRRLDQTRHSLEVSRERFALAAAGSDEGIWDWDVVGDRVYASARAREIFGLDPGPDVQSRDQWFEQVRLHPDDVPGRREAMQAHLAGDAAVYAGEYRVLGRDGQYRWVRVRGLCVRNAAGEPLRMAGSVTDIDDRKRTEQALRLSEERFALAVAGSNDGIVDWDIVNDRMYTSERTMEMLGVDSTVTVRSRAEWLALLNIHPDDKRRHADELQRFLASDEALREGEYRIIHRDGSCRWVRLRNLCVRDAQGRPLRLAGSVSDIDPYKKVEAALRESEQQYAMAMTGSNEGHYVWDLASDDFFASAKLNEIMGLPEAPQLTKHAERIALLPRPADDETRVRQAIDDLLAGVTTQMDVEYRIMPPEGGVRWVQSRGRCFRDADGKPVRIAGSVTDITARKQADEALRLSKERFALAVAGSDDGVWDWDFVAGIAFESARARELQGLPPGPEEQPLPLLLDSLRVHPDDAARRAEGIRAHLAGETAAYECEYRVLHDDGEYRWIRVRALCIRDDAGQPCRMAGSVSDIDSRKRAEEALRRSDERYQLAVAGSNEGLWDWDLASDSLFLSPRAQELLWQQAGPPQRPRREWITITDYHPDDIGLVREAIAAHLHGRTQHFKVEYRVRRRNGEWRWYRQRGIAVRDADGRPTRMAGSMEDITERKQSEAERERLEVQLRQAQKLEAIGTLAGGIAHDFNNILAAILGYGEMALKDAAEGSAQQRNIEAAMSAGLRAKSLVERILAFSRSGMGERSPVHVQSVVVEALDVVAASLPAGIALERRLAAGDAAVLGDPTQVHQVVMNLCANAVQAMKSSGKLTVSLERIELTEPCCTTSVTLAGGHYVALRVGDTGGGIAAPLLERIFDPFFTTKEVGVGTGLGLSLVHGIVTDLGGGICVDSVVGEGSSFTVLLPWQRDIAPAPALAEAAVPNGNGETVLLVDDEEPLVRLGEEMVAMLGYEPVGFTSSVEALATFRADPDRFHAVLSDEAMPEMTGSELVAEIRRIRPDIPIVLMSGYVTAALAARARKSGVAEVLAKPLVSRDIARSLANALQRQGSETTLS